MFQGSRNRALAGASMGALMLACAVPALAQSAPTDETDEANAITVIGQRASDKASLDKKRASDTTSEVVSANDVGKLPDQNVAEAVRRVSGVSVATDKGEGRYLIIRGIEPNLANVTINNQTASAPEPENRNVKLDDIPSGLIGSVTVIKTLTPDLDANAIAGQVDIDTVSAFDKKGNLFGSARAVYGLYEDTDRTAKEGDVSIGGRFGSDRQFGLVAAGNYSKRPSYSEDVLSTSRQPVGGVDLPAEMDQRIYDPAIRTRKGAVVNFDWRPSDSVKLYARYLYSQFGDSEQRNRFRFLFPGSAANYTGLTADGGTINTGTTTARRLLRNRQETTDTNTFSLGGEFEFSDLKLTVEGTHAKSRKRDPVRDEVEYRAAAGTGLGATFDFGSGMPDGFTANAAALNPANYRLNNYKQVSRLAGETLDQIRADLEIPFRAIGDDSTIKVGAKYLKRDRFQDQTGRTFGSPTGVAATRTVADDLAGTTPTIFDGAYTFGPTINFNSAQAFVFANPGLFTVNAADEVSQSKTSDYRVKETVTAGYVMATIRSGGLTVIPGVRVEHTVGDTAAVIYRAGVTTLNSDFDSFGHYSYTNWFPSVNAKYVFSRNLQVRAAVTTAIGRPAFVNLAPTVSVDGGPVGATVSLGNPNLQPQKSLNFDAGIEYYFDSEGGISISAFHKHIRNPIFATSLTGQNGTFGGIAVTNSTVNSFANGESGTLTGVEFAVQKPLTFLPSPFDGLGINANLTLSHSSLKVPHPAGGLRTIHTPMVGQASTIASVQVYYEKYGISARVAGTYHSAYLDTDGGLNVGDPTGQSDGYFGAVTTIDARFAYRFTKFLEVFVEGNNLTDAQDYYYFGTPGRFREGEKYGRSMRLGVTFTY